MFQWLRIENFYLDGNTVNRLSRGNVFLTPLTISNGTSVPANCRLFGTSVTGSAVNTKSTCALVKLIARNKVCKTKSPAVEQDLLGKPFSRG